MMTKDFTLPTPGSYCTMRVMASAMIAAELMAVIVALAPEQVDNRWETFGLASLLIQWITLLSVALLCRLSRKLEIGRESRLLALSVLVVISVTFLVSIALDAFQYSQQQSGRTYRMLGIAIAISALAHIAFRIHVRSQRMEVSLREAELGALRARVDPHFLFNTLNMATALVHEQPGQAEQILLDLSDLFRATLSGSGEHQLAEEVTLTRRYLEIEQLRLGARLHVEWRLPAPLPALRLPSLSLQTLVENAVRHGIEPLPSGGKLSIDGECHANEFRLRISNPFATAIDSTTVPGHRVGIAATRARIEAMTKSRGSLQTRSDGDLFVAELRIPLPE